MPCIPLDLKRPLGFRVLLQVMPSGPRAVGRTSLRLHGGTKAREKMVLRRPLLLLFNFGS
jgi:hypothetical protein